MPTVANPKYVFKSCFLAQNAIHDITRKKMDFSQDLLMEDLDFFKVAVKIDIFGLFTSSTLVGTI